MGLNLIAALIDDFDCRAFLSNGPYNRASLCKGLYSMASLCKGLDNRVFVIAGDCIAVALLEDEENHG
jgi:hypothetical protein